MIIEKKKREVEALEEKEKGISKKKLVKGLKEQNDVCSRQKGKYKNGSSQIAFYR